MERPYKKPGDELAINPPAVEGNARSYRAMLDDVYKKLDRSDAADIKEIHKLFDGWQRANAEIIPEDFDSYLILINDFLSINDAFENMSVVGVGVRERKPGEMDKSIEAQRTLIRLLTKCTSIDEAGNVNVVESQKDNFNKLAETMAFMSRIVNELLRKDSLRSNTSNAAKFLSGLRSMACASVLVRAAGYKVTFADQEYDRNYDLDMVLNKDGVKIALDVTTTRASVDADTGFSLKPQNSRSVMPEYVWRKLNLTRIWRLVLPSIASFGEYYDSDAGRHMIGIPSRKIILSFKEVAEEMY